jgi:hypothetical protein
MRHSMHDGSVRTIDDLQELISYMVLYAPDEFPVEDYLAENQQMTLDRAFRELQNGIQVVIQRGMVAAEVEDQVRVLAEQAAAAYKQGDDVTGAHLLQEIEAQLVGS